MNDLMRECPKWESCSAPICPLDDDWELRSHFAEDVVCRYLREWAKIQSGMADLYAFQRDLPHEAQKRIQMGYGDIIADHRTIERAMERASKTPSKLQSREFGTPTTEI